MPITMDDLVAAALRAAREKFPPVPRVVDMKFQLGRDAAGDNAVRIWVILDDATPGAQLHHVVFQPMEEQIRAAIGRALREGTQFQLDLVPYVYFRLKSEQDEIEAGGAE